MSADARDDNMFASVTSADSVTEHIEEPREVPESSMSSIFFDKNNFLSSSSSTRLREQDKIIIDTQEINLQYHSLVYFDFDLRKKIILLLHLLFILSFMTVSCSQMSNMLELVHLLPLSKSLLIVLDEFEKTCILLVRCFS